MAKKGEVKEVSEDGVVTTVSAEPEVKKAVKKESIRLLVSFIALDEERNKTTVKLEAEGESAEEVVAKINTPKGLNANVNVTLKVGEVELLRSIPPIKSRAIFENKRADVLKAVFRGLL